MITNLLLFNPLREYLASMSPPVLTALRSYHDAKGLQIEARDAIAIIDGRSELKLIKGQNQRTYDIGVFPRALLEQRRAGDVQMRQSSAAQGSAFGFCWGGGPAPNSAEDRRQRKCASLTPEAAAQAAQAVHGHVRERKSASNKQFAYNKLINECGIGLRRCNAVKGRNWVPPNRPPPPKAHPPPKQQEGILIDISPEVRPVADSASLHVDSSFCLLDAPIDVPTFNDAAATSRDVVAAYGSGPSTPTYFNEQPQFEFGTTSPGRLQPPPYQMPPTYSNTMEFAQKRDQQQTPVRDPFDTSNLETPSNALMLYSNTSAAAAAPPAMPAPIYSSPGVRKSLFGAGSDGSSNGHANKENIPALESAAMQINLSNLSLERQEQYQAPPPVAAPPELPSSESVLLDKSFIAELEKDMYSSSNKAQEDYQRNSSQMYSNKEIVYKQNLTPLKNAVDHHQSNHPSPTTSNGSQGSPTAKQNNVEPAGATQSLVNRIWYERVAAPPSEYYAQPPAEPEQSEQLYQNHQQQQVETHHSFVAISNRVVAPKAPSVYASSGSLYGATGDRYDPVAASTAGSTYYGQVPNGSGGDGNAAIYDEVTHDDYLRPHRPAPLAPPPLSAQQIQRRLDKMRQQQQQQLEGAHQLYAPIPADAQREAEKMQQLLLELGSSAVEQDVRNALRAASGDVQLALRHYKIDQLTRLGVAGRPQCEQALHQTNWSLEMAAELLLQS